MRPKIEPLRWTINQIVLEFAITANKFKAGCRACGIESGRDKKYSTKEVVDALFGSNGLEKKAKESRWQSQIDDAEVIKLKRQETKGLLVPKADVETFLTDALLKVTQVIRHSNLTEQDKAQAINELKTVEFKGGKIVVKQ